MPGKHEGRRSPWPVAVTLAVVATALLVAVSGPIAQAATRPAPAQRAVYDGESLLRGLFFGQGPVAQQHPELALTRVEGADAKAMTDRLVADVKRQDPRFPARFAVEVQSGDRVRVRAAVSEAADLLRQAVTRAYGVTPESRAASVQGNATLIAALIAAAAVVLWVYVAIYVVNDEQDAERVPAGLDPGASSLKTEVWVDEVTTTLRG
jgi:SdpC family antimicrobial peptide